MAKLGSFRCVSIRCSCNRVYFNVNNLILNWSVSCSFADTEQREIGDLYLGWMLLCSLTVRDMVHIVHDVCRADRYE